MNERLTRGWSQSPSCTVRSDHARIAVQGDHSTGGNVEKKEDEAEQNQQVCTKKRNIGVYGWQKVYLSLESWNRKKVISTSWNLI